MTPREELSSVLEELKNSQVPLCISLAGNIGSGKSSLLTVLIDTAGQELLEVVYEPLDKLQKLGGTDINLLETFYSDPTRYGYLFQSVIALMRGMDHQTPIATGKKLRVMERCGLSDFVFPKTLYKTGVMSETEWIAYNAVFVRYINEFLPRKPDLIIYVDLAPEVCFERKHLRNRGEEEGVPLEYLQALHETHEEWMPCPENGVSVEFDTEYIRVSSLPDYVNDEDEQVKVTLRILKAVVARIPSIVEKRKAILERELKDLVLRMKESGIETAL